MKYLFFVLLVSALLISSCKKDGDIPINENVPCNENQLPILMLHGLLASSDTYNNFYQLFNSNGYCEELLFVMDRNTLDFSADFIPDLDSAINHILETTNKQQLNLMGHSAGGALGYDYLSNETSKGKVAKYVHLASFPQPQAAGLNAEIPTLNIWSEGDLVLEGANIEGAENLMLENEDHYEVATSSTSFKKIYEFFNNNTTPEFTTVQLQKGDNITLSGKVVTLGENAPLKNAQVEIFQLDKETGARLNQKADHTVRTNQTGNWSKVEIKANEPYEFYVTNLDNTEDTPMHYYREGFTRSTPLVYLRTIPPKGSPAGAFLGEIPSNDEQSVLVVFSSSQAIIHQRDVLIVNDVELSTAEFASADQTTIALFLYDDGDKKSGLTSTNALLKAQPFLNAVDFFIDPQLADNSTIVFNNNTLNIPNWPSGSNGVSVVVFD